MRNAVLALAWLALAACTVQRAHGLGTPCQTDEDCPRRFFCGADAAEEGDDARICVPEAECDPAVFDVACAGPGYYSCVDDQVHFTECESGACQDGACVE